MDARVLKFLGLCLIVIIFVFVGIKIYCPESKKDVPDKPVVDTPHQPPNFRRVRVFNGSDFKVSSIRIRITKPTPAKDLGNLILNVDPHRAGSNDADVSGFRIVNTATVAGAATELEITIVMDDDGTARTLPAYTIGVASAGYKIGGVLIGVENNPNPKTWSVTTCSFSHSDDMQALARYPAAPAPVSMTAP